MPWSRNRENRSSSRPSIPYLTCDDICIPYTAELNLTLPAGPAEPSEHAHLISRYAASVPGDGAGHGLMLADAAALSPGDAAKGEMTISVRAKSETPFSAPDIYLEGPNVLAYSKPHVTFSDNGREARLDVTVYGVKDLDGGGGPPCQGNPDGNPGRWNAQRRTPPDPDPR